MDKMAEHLGANHVNYIVWRYLQESGFGDAAVKLQRDWMPDPQALPHATTVKNHMLITLVQKGLQLCELETRLKNSVPNQIPAQFFNAVTPPSSTHTVAAAVDTTISIRHGDATEEDEKANGATVLSETAETPASAPSVAVGPAEPVVPRLTTGPSVGTQVEPVIELASQTAVLDTGVGDVLYSVWSPNDPTKLATAGSDALARFWKFTWPDASSAHELQSSKVDTFDQNGVPWVVSSLAWHPTGSKIAVAVYNNDNLFENEVAVWRDTGEILAMYPKSAMPILDLRWSPSGSVLVAVCASNTGSEAYLWNPITTAVIDCITLSEGVEHVRWIDDDRFFLIGSRLVELHCLNGRRTTLLRRYDIPHQGDITLTQQDLITQKLATVTAEGVIDIWNLEGHLRSFSAHESDVTRLEWQPLPGLGLASLSIHDNNEMDTGNDDSAAQPNDQLQQPRRLASASLDGTVRIWNGNAPYQCLHTLPLGLSRFPVMTMAFSPDGSVLAAATSGKALMWEIPNSTGRDDIGSNTANGNSQLILPKCSWQSPESGRFGTAADGAREAVTGSGNATNNGGDDEMSYDVDRDDGVDFPHYTLAWNADGSRLAYAVQHEIAIIPYH